MLSDSQKEEFHTKGFTVVQNAIPAELIEAVRARVEPVFSGDFQSGYPDDWAWRPHFGSPTATRFMINVWKCDPTIANVALDPRFAQAASELAGWKGARIANDSLWWKPAGSKQISFHQDASEWQPFLTPSEMVTCWIALDDCIEGVGTLQFVVGSHRWPLLRDVRAVLADLRRPPHERAAEATAIQAGIQDYKVESVTGSAGLCVFHHGYVWHGSESNTSATQMRRSLAIHYLSDITRYGNGTPKFLFARYKDDTDELSSRHFPILWRAEEAKG